MGVKKKVLIVDDDQTFRQLLAYALEDSCDVVMASDGAEGLNIARDARPDMLILDVMMPKVSGLEVLRSLTAEEETKKIPVLICSGSRFDSSTRDLFKLERNCVGFFSKTDPVGSIVAKVMEVLKIRAN